MALGPLYEIKLMAEIQGKKGHVLYFTPDLDMIIEINKEADRQEKRILDLVNSGVTPSPEYVQKERDMARDMVEQKLKLGKYRATDENTLMGHFPTEYPRLVGENNTFTRKSEKSPSGTYFDLGDK